MEIGLFFQKLLVADKHLVVQICQLLAPSALILIEAARDTYNYETSSGLEYKNTQKLRGGIFLMIAKRRKK
jgi:hypothetical protein